MFNVRDIIYFKPFYFKSGNPAKNKFFVVLKESNEKTILASLPTSKDHVPKHISEPFGCVELPDINFNCFVIPEYITVTECGKYFDRNTFLYGAFLYGALVDEYDTKMMNELYPFENINFELWGKMRQYTFNELTCCFKNSKSVKRKYKRLLLH